jgi:hypothetical protein
VVDRDRETPQDPSRESVMPIPIADPPATVLATAAVAGVITMARQNPAPGVSVIHTNP